MSVEYLGNPADQMVRNLQSLAVDIERLRDGWTPGPGDLAEAPLLDAWRPVLQPGYVLAGRVTGHPLVGRATGVICTSPLFAIDPLHGWARTWSRFYRLGASVIERASKQG